MTTTERIRRLLLVCDLPLTGTEIITKLKHLGWAIPKDKNPHPLVAGICKRLTTQKYAVLSTKNGVKAWTIIPELKKHLERFVA